MNDETVLGAKLVYNSDRGVVQIRVIQAHGVGRSGAGLPNPGARAQACRPTAGTGRLRAFRRQGMIRRQPAAADAGR